MKRLIRKALKGLILKTAAKAASKLVSKVKPLPGYLLKPLMAGSLLERLLSSSGTISVNTLNLLMGKYSNVELAIIKKVLDEKFAGLKNIDYNEFRKAVLDELITYLRVNLTKYANYGLERLGLDTPRDPAGLSIDGYKDIDRLNTFTFESPRILLGDTRHYEGYPLGHSRTFTTREEPDILYVMESLSDASLGGAMSAFEKYRSDLSKISRAYPQMTRLLRRQNLLNDLKKELSTWERMLKTQLDDHGDYLYLSLLDNIRYDIIPRTRKQILDLEYLIGVPETDVALAKYLFNNYLRRLLQENLKYAAENGLTRMRYPTPETAAKIEGYSKEMLTPEYSAAQEDVRRLNVLDGDLAPVPDEINLFADSPAEMVYYTPEKRAELLKQALQRVSDLEKSGKDRTYSEQHQTILKKYADFPKMFRKLYLDLDVRTVTDSKGNTWFEVDVPSGYLYREWPYKKGGKLILKHLKGKIIGKVISSVAKKLLPKTTNVSKQLIKNKFVDNFGKTQEKTPWPGTDEELLSLVLKGLVETLRLYWDKDKINQIKQTMGWGDKEIAELLDELLRSIGTLTKAEVKGVEDGFKNIASHRGLAVKHNNEIVGDHTITLNRDRIPNEKVALEAIVHEIGAHGKTMGIDKRRILTNKGYLDMMVAFPRLTDLMLKNGELAESILKPNKQGRFFAKHPTSSDIELYIEKNKDKLSKELIDALFSLLRYYKYLNTDLEKYARAYTGLLMDRLGYKDTENIQQLKNWFTDESVDKFKNAVLGFGLPLTFGYFLFNDQKE